MPRRSRWDEAATGGAPRALMRLAYPLFEAIDDRVAWITETATLRRRDFWGHVSRAAARLSAELSVREVVIAAERPHDLAIGLFATWQAGKRAVLLRPGLCSEARALVSDPASAVVLASGEPPPSGLLAIELPTQSLGEAGKGELAEPAQLPASEPCITLYTSGSTGRPEPVVKAAYQLMEETRVLCQHYGFGPGRVILTTVPGYHIYGLLFGILVPLFSGARVIAVSPLHPASLLEHVTSRGVTDWISVPAHLSPIAEFVAREGGLERALRIFSSAAPLSPAVREKLDHALGHPVVELLGSTETGGIAERRGPGRWSPLPGVEVSADATGSIQVSSPFLGPAEQPCFRGADQVSVEPDGSFEHLGRSDGVVKIAGRRTSLQEIEARVRELSGVDDAAAIALPTPSLRGTEIGLAVVAPGWSVPRLRQALVARLDALFVPRRIRLLPALPRDASGKLPKERLLELFETLAVTEEFLIAPDHPRFEGHFPGAPVWPAAAQLCELVLPAIVATWPELDQLESAPRIKFTRPLRPGERVSLNVRRAARSNRVHFEISRSGEICTSGALGFKTDPRRDAERGS